MVYIGGVLHVYTTGEMCSGYLHCLSFFAVSLFSVVVCEKAIRAISLQYGKAGRFCTPYNTMLSHDVYLSPGKGCIFQRLFWLVIYFSLQSAVLVQLV